MSPLLQRYHGLIVALQIAYTLDEQAKEQAADKTRKDRKK